MTLCIIDNHNKLLVIKQVEGFRPNNIMKTCKIIFLEYGLYIKIVSYMYTPLFQKNLETSSGICQHMSCKVHNHTTIKTMDKKKHA